MEEWIIYLVNSNGVSSFGFTYKGNLPGCIYRPCPASIMDLSIIKDAGYLRVLYKKYKLQITNDSIKEVTYVEEL